MDRFKKFHYNIKISRKLKIFIQVSGHDNGLVKLWDYKQKIHIHTFNLSEKDELRKEKLIVQKIIEKDLKVEFTSNNFSN